MPPVTESWQFQHEALPIPGAKYIPKNCKKLIRTETFLIKDFPGALPTYCPKNLSNEPVITLILT